MSHRSAVAITTLAAALTLGLAGSAGAAALDAAELRLDVRNLGIQYGTGVLPGVSPAGASLGGSGAVLLGGSAFSGVDVLGASTTPPLFDEIQVQIGDNAFAAFLGTPIAGRADFTGMLGLTSAGGWFISVPLQLGGTGTTMVTGFAATGGTPVVATLSQGPFQTGVVTVGGTGATPLIGTGINALTPAGEGDLLLVAPVRILAPVGLDFQAIATLDLRFVPEPGSASLLVWGAACMALLGRQKLKRRQVESQAQRR